MMEKTLVNKIKNNGELIVFIFFFFLFVFQLFIGSSVQKINNQNYKENIERIKNELKNIDDTSLKTNNLKKEKSHFGFIHYFIWSLLIFISISFCCLTIKRNYIRHGHFDEENNVQYFFRTINSSNLDTNDDSYMKDFFI